MGGDIWKEACGRRQLGGGILEETFSGLQYFGNSHLEESIWEQSSGRRNLKEASGRRHLRGGTWKEAPRKNVSE